MLRGVTGLRCATCRRRTALEAGGRCPGCWRAVVGAGDEARRSSAARDPDLPGWALAALAADRSPLVRAEVAARTDLPDSVVAVLADPRTEPDVTVLRRMAGHARLGARALALAAVGDVVTLRRLADNPAAPPDVLTVLAGHPDPTVGCRARARLLGAGLDDVARRRLPAGLRRYLT
jgi:hypothetical protein